MDNIACCFPENVSHDEFSYLWFFLATSSFDNLNILTKLSTTSSIDIDTIPCIGDFKHL